MLRRIKAVESVLLSERNNGIDDSSHPEHISDSRLAKNGEPADALAKAEAATSPHKNASVAVSGMEEEEKLSKPRTQLGATPTGLSAGLGEHSHNRSQLAFGNEGLTPVDRHQSASAAHDESAGADKKQDASHDSRSGEVFPLRVDELGAERFLQWYRTRLSSKFVKSFSPLSDLVNRSQTGYEPCWLCYAGQDYPKEGVGPLLQENRSLESVQGFAVFYTDPGCQARSRVTILHVSVLDDDRAPQRLPQFIKKLLDYIWMNVGCEEVRVELAHFMQEGKLAPYDALKAAFHAIKFRWKTLINDQQGNRMVVLGLARPTENVFANPRGISYGQEPITFKHGVVLAISNTETKTENEQRKQAKGKWEELLLTQCSYLEALREFAKQAGIQKPELALGETTDPFMRSMAESQAKLATLSSSLTSVASKALCCGEADKVTGLLAGQKLSVSVSKLAAEGATVCLVLY